MSDKVFRDKHANYPATMLIIDDNASDLPLHERLIHLFVSHFFRPIGSKHTTIRQIDYWLMHQVKASNKVNLSALIFQNFIKVIRDSI